ncbi:MAG TPA: hypothetical protein VKA74_16490, partial [Myxococcota bacterium]|nr:hypothetical protein [Myxococcota bacterium]
MRRRHGSTLAGLLAALLLVLVMLEAPPVDTHEGESASAASPGAEALQQATGLDAREIGLGGLIEGRGPPDFEADAGVPYRPSYNADPAIPVQCWVETGYGTQNACKYCHTPELTRLGHGNAWPVDESIEAQVFYSFERPNLNKVHWDNVVRPAERTRRLRAMGVELPEPGDEENLRWVRTPNWPEAYARARPDGDSGWSNEGSPESPLRLLPALDPGHLHPFEPGDPTDGRTHGYVDARGFVRDEAGEATGWRAVDFFPYAIFTPLAGSVSGIYIRLPEPFRSRDGELDLAIYAQNLDLLEKAIKTPGLEAGAYRGDASAIPVRAGLYPVGTELAHPLHYVDLAADGESGEDVDGVVHAAVGSALDAEASAGSEEPFTRSVESAEKREFEFPGLRSKRVKEVRYAYKWRDVEVEEITTPAQDDRIIGGPGQGWVANGQGWILAGYIEDSEGRLRPQTTEELMQCVGCHGRVGNTVDSVWSFQRKLPGDAGWGEMDYGDYDSERPHLTRLQDYRTRTRSVDKGEQEYFYGSVVGA